MFFTLISTLKTILSILDFPFILIPCSLQAVQKLLTIIIGILFFQFKGLKFLFLSPFYLKIELSDNLLDEGIELPK